MCVRVGVPALLSLLCGEFSSKGTTKKIIKKHTGNTRQKKKEMCSKMLQFVFIFNFSFNAIF